MELVLKTLKEKKFYLEHNLEDDCNKFEDCPDIIKRLKQNIKDFEKAIDTIELYINIKKH
jgi:hypothetical protein